MVELVMGILTDLLKLAPTLQDVLYKHLDRRSRKKRDLADQLASHLTTITRLFRKSAKLIREGDKKGEIGRVCSQLHAEVELLGNNVMAKVIGATPTKRFLVVAHRAADVEALAAELAGKPAAEIEPYLKTLEEAVGIFRALGNEAKRRGSHPR